MLEPVQTYPSALLKGRVPGELHAVLMAIRPSTGDHYRRPPIRRQVCGLWSCGCLSNSWGQGPRFQARRRRTQNGPGAGPMTG